MYIFYKKILKYYFLRRKCVYKQRENLQSWRTISPNDMNLLTQESIVEGDEVSLVTVTRPEVFLRLISFLGTNADLPGLGNCVYCKPDTQNIII